ncbi:ParB/RepB/Spo0J family partition protein [Candidatus Bathyarchaeota archaeon]|nr:MAG: ParB/RepB/Spo0J family partition protein [Candidatus Bathyarchaeota archaeon]
MDVKTISIEDIELRHDNPRFTFADETLDELSASLKRDGIIEPIVVRPKGLRYELIIGERRVRAAIRANIPRLPAIIRGDISDEEASRLRLVENINRKDLNVFEKVNGIEAHREKFGRTIDEIAEELGKRVETVRSWIRLAEATSPKIKIVDNFVRKLGTQKLMEISKYNFETQEKLAEKITANNLTVDHVRRFVILFENNPDADLDTLVRKVKEQVKTIEVTLPVEEADRILKRSKEVRKKEKKAEKKLKRHLRERTKRQAIVPTEPNKLESAQLESLEIPVELPSIKKVRETELAKLAEKEKFSVDEVKRLSKLDKANPTLSPKEVVEMVKKQIRPQIVVLEISPKLYGALEAYANSQRVFIKEAVLMILEQRFGESRILE